jgi:alkanesulfonate monooxygenase SsuD/methylene tetrahydromethanopterin reductase-like flavin-dependent oxidoreductase (luciferase family)
VIFDIFSELQRPGARASQDFRAVYSEAIEQAELADVLGFGCWWAVEHHGTPEFSLSSVPEMILLAIAQKTERLRLGHAAVLAPFKINHPLRVAERAAFIDVMSNGRMELGLARAGGSEWETFGVESERTRAEITEAFHMIPRMWREDPFKWESELISIPERHIVPRPVQEPHPRMWATAASPDGFEFAGRLGVGVLATGFMTPFSVIQGMLDRYAKGLAECRPSGERINDQRTLFTFLHVAETREEVIRSGALEAALWFMNEAPKVFRNSRQVWLDMVRGTPAESGVDMAAAVDGPEPDAMDIDDPHPVVRLLNRAEAGVAIDPEEIYDAFLEIDGVIIGDIEVCRRKIELHTRLGIDRLGCFAQFGALTHEPVMKSLRIAGEVLLPEFSKT